MTSSGKLFQILAPAIGNAQLPTVDRRVMQDEIQTCMTRLHLSFFSTYLAVSLIQSPMQSLTSSLQQLLDHPIPLLPGTQPCTFYVLSYYVHDIY